jgi:cytochrome c oxidase cbb3-type subunit III
VKRRSLRRLAHWLPVVAVTITGCEREKRPFNEPREAREAPAVARTSHQAQGSRVPADSPYRRNAWGIAEGKRLFSAYNCVGCHSHGGGGMGPALMDSEWIYGSDPENIFATVVEGRPNGMPAFGGKLATSQVWQLVAYVRSLSGLLAKDVAPGREDALYGAPQEQATHEQRPVESSRPPQAEQP